jgi:hypothetical protein
MLLYPFKKYLEDWLKLSLIASAMPSVTLDPTVEPPWTLSEALVIDIFANFSERNVPELGSINVDLDPPP